MTVAAEQIQHDLANFNNDQFWIGENMSPDGVLALLGCCEDSATPYVNLCKDGLEMET